MFPNFYKDMKSEYIIDRSTWGLLDYIKLAKKHIKNELKIIILVRDIPEILASFVDHSNKYTDFYLNKIGRTELEKCDFLMRYDNHSVGQLYGQLSSIKNMLLNYKENIKIIEYNDLVNNTEFTINSVYDYLEIDKFKHDFTNLAQININGIGYNDSVLGGELHKIRTDKIEKRKYNIEDVLPQYVIKKYTGYEIWRDMK